jgi:hypothetical protein
MATNELVIVKILLDIIHYIIHYNMENNLNQYTLDLYWKDRSVDIEKYLKLGVDPTYDKHAFFKIAISSGDCENLEKLIHYDKTESILTYKYLFGLSLVNEEYECTKVLLKHGVNINDYDKSPHYSIIKDIYDELQEERMYSEESKLD